MILPCEHPAAGPVRKWKTLRAFSKAGLARRLVHRPVVAGMLDQPAARLHQPMPLAGQRPVLESLGATARIPCSGCMTGNPEITSWSTAVASVAKVEADGWTTNRLESA